MMTSSNGSIFGVTDHYAGNSPVTDEFPSQRPVTRSFDVCAWTHDWVNNRGANDLRCHRAHYEVTVMVMVQITSDDLLKVKLPLHGDSQYMWEFRNELWQILTFISLHGIRSNGHVRLCIATVIIINRYLKGCALEYCSWCHANCQYRKLFTISDLLCYTTKSL